MAKSTRVEPSSRTTGKVYGDLTIRGVTREVIFDVTQVYQLQQALAQSMV